MCKLVQCKFCQEDGLKWFQEDGRWVLKKELENGQYSVGNHNCKSKDFKKNNVGNAEQSQLSLEKKEKKF